MIPDRSTKAGAPTPATPTGYQPMPSRPIALNEGRGSNPGDTPRRTTQRRGRIPLNEGRGSNPGDTRSAGDASRLVDHAQRRPGLQPRRHATGHVYQGGNSIAQRRPGLQPRRHSRFSVSRPSFSSAQRRPGLQPRRHHLRRPLAIGRQHRSTKAGAPTPATPPVPAVSLK